MSLAISIIIPAFNIEGYLPACIDSIVHQVNDEVEVIIVNDGSTDNTGSIADSFALDYDFIKVIHQSNQGVSAARNKAIQESTRKYLVFLDSDDLLYEGFFQKVLELIKHQPDIIEINAKLIDKENKVLRKKIFLLESKKTSFNNTDEAKLRLSKQAKYYLWSRIIRKQLVDDLRFDERISFCEDALYITECYFRAKKIITIDESLYGYRQHDSNATVAKTIHNIDQLTDLSSILLNKIYSSQNEEYKNYYLYLLVNMVHLRKSMYTLELKKIFCDEITVKQIREIKNYYKWSFFKLQNEISWLRRLSITVPKISNMLILLKFYIRNS